ncbi:MAG TPA: alpha-amylase family glycosyl hydrolase [Lentimicrobium sp.]|nr:alpha-amylase family glycosyl hydrolase [Lentimicrobium sp.]
MKKISLSIVTVLLTVSVAFAQITTDPQFPTDNQPVEVTFNATEGNGGLSGYTGDVYAHTGVITNLSSGPSDWKYVKTNWGQNTPETKLERIGTDLYRFTTGTQTIRDYYGVPASEQILKLAFVFRSDLPVNNGNYFEGKTNTGGDIFADVYSVGLFVKIDKPVNYANLVDPETEFVIEASSTLADSIVLFIDNVKINSISATTLKDTIITETEGKHFLKVTAHHEDEIAYDSAYYFVKPEVTVAEMPENIKSGINYINDSTVILSLYAPAKQDVFILGDFNNWEYDATGQMYKDPDGNNWWRQVDGLEPGKEYIFQYWVDGIVVADPFADKYLDPWNDQYISEETYPGLINYPFDKTSQFASVLQTAQPQYQWMSGTFDPPAQTDLVIYELLLRDFIAAHDYQTLIDTLSYLKRLGVNAIELMPVYEFEGNSSWGYNTAFHFAPDKYYGPKNDLKQFIDACHQQGFAVIFDIVLNHVFGSSPFARLYWDAANNRPAADNPWLNPIAKHDFNVGYDFNHESQATKDLVKRVVEYWITDYKVDGYRFDLSKGFTQKNTLGNTDAWGQYDASRIAIWKDIANKIWAVKPETYIILEHFADNSEEKELSNYGMMLWGNLNYAFRRNVMGKSSDLDISWLSYKTRGWNDPHVVGYMESHDEERLMFSILDDGNMSNQWYNIKHPDTAYQRIIAASAFFYIIPGPKMLWQFGELAYDYSIEYNGRLGEKPIRWDYQDDWRRKHLFTMTAELIKLKKEHDVFRTTDYTLNVSGPLKSANLIDDEMSVTLIGNFGVINGQIVPGFNQTGKWYNYFTGDSLNVISLTDKITLKPGEFRLYTSKRLTVPETGLAVPEQMVYTNVILKQVFPNPAKDEINISLDIPDKQNIRIVLTDLNGQELKTVFERNFVPGTHTVNVDISGIASGMYFLKLVTKERIEAQKVFKY